MRRCSRLLPIVFGVCACNGDPTLDISVRHPGTFKVSQTVVTVYFGGDISCSQIEFGDRTDAELSAITVDEVDVTHGGSVVVSRLGGKSIVARGFDDQHRFVTAGCKDVGEIAGVTQIEIDTLPTAVVAIDPSAPDRPFAERTILVNMMDVKGKPIDGMVSWLLSGPAGAAEQQPSDGIATKNGNARITVQDLGTPGPEGLRIRAPWATTPLPLVTAFDLANATSVPLGGGAIASAPSCDVRGHAGGLATLVCLTQANVQLHRDAVEIAWNGSGYDATPITIPGTLDNQFALFVDHDGSASEPVYVLSATADGTGKWYKLGAPAGSATPEVFGDGLQNVVYIPRCKDNSASALVVVQTGSAALASNVQFFTAAGAPINPTTGRQLGEVFSGGCIADVDAREHQAVVVVGNNPNADAQLVLITNQTPAPNSIATAKLTGSGFITAEAGGTTEKRFAGARLQATGTVVFEAVLAPLEGGSFKLLERSEVEAAGPPIKILAGKLDRDGDTDLMWDMAVTARRRVFQVSLAKQVSGAPLTGMTSGPSPPATTAAVLTDFLVANLNGMATDEMILFTQTGATIYSADQ